MANDRRIKRLEMLILQTLAPAIAHGLADPRLSMVTVTRIRLSKDLGIARVNWSCLGTDGDRSKTSHALEKARGYLQSAVAAAIRTRTTPRLEFHFDEGLAHAVRVNTILGDLARERAAREGVEVNEFGEPIDPEVESEDQDTATEGSELDDAPPVADSTSEDHAPDNTAPADTAPEDEAPAAPPTNASDDARPGPAKPPAP